MGEMDKDEILAFRKHSTLNVLFLKVSKTDTITFAPGIIIGTFEGDTGSDIKSLQLSVLSIFDCGCTSRLYILSQEFAGESGCLMRLIY